MKYKKQQLEDIATKLHTLPEVDKKNQEYTKKEAVKVLAKEIQLLKKRGYTLDQISAALCEEGLEINTASLKQYLQRKKRVKKGVKIQPKKILKSEVSDKKKETKIPPQLRKKKETKTEKKNET